MKIISNYLLVGLLAIITMGCCGIWACPPPAVQLQLRLVDTTSGEDMLINGQLDVETLELRYADGSLVNFEYNPSAEQGIIAIVEYESGDYQYVLTISPDIVININSKVADSDSKCCPRIELPIINIDSYQYEKEVDVS